MPRTDRREFLRHGALASAAALALGHRPARAAGTGKVVHVHHGRAATWDRVTGMYRDAVDQAAVNQMLDEAVMALKGGGLEGAWRAVFGLAGNETRRLSIKISCNNATDSVNGAGTDIDAIAEPALAVVRGFLIAGGDPANVNIYDATNTVPTRYIATWFRERVAALYPAVLFNAPWGAGGSGCGPQTCVPWDPAWISPPPDMRYAGAITGSDYVVNIPIVKRHSQANFSLGFKNHFGSVDRCDRLHGYVYADTPEASVLADILSGPIDASNPAVVPLYRKTVLTVGDMLFGQPCKNFQAPPRPWVTWGNEWPNVLIVSDDVVAADSVMADLVDPEPASDGGCGSVRAWARRYLTHAERKGLGVYDHVALPAGKRFDAARMLYTKIDYRFVDVWSSGAALRVTRASGGVLLQWEHYFAGICEIYRGRRRDFTDAVRIGVSPAGQYFDPAPPEPAFYKIRYAG